jgi:hypothetical protein
VGPLCGPGFTLLELNADLLFKFLPELQKKDWHPIYFYFNKKYIIEVQAFGKIFLGPIQNRLLGYPQRILSPFW